MKDSQNLDSMLANVKGLAKNPLGIIALFISLIYGFACLVLGITGSGLESNERLVLIIFLVFFPILILVSFIFLVTKHYRKLYAPSDFKDEKNYLETIDIKAQKSRIQNQTIEIKKQKYSSDSQIVSSHNDRFNNYLIVENLLLRIIQRDYNLPLRRNVKFKKHESTFDCVLEGKNMFIAVEIKYYSHIEDEYAEVVSLHYKRRLHSFQRISKEYFPEIKCKFILYIVHDNHIENFRHSLSRIFNKENIMDFEIRFLKYKELLSKFGIEK